MRVGDDLLGNGVAPAWIRIDAAIAQRVISDAFRSNGEIAPLFMEKAAAIRDEILQIAKLWTVHGWVIDLCNDPVPDRIPKVAGGGIGGADTTLVAVGPAGLDSRSSEGFVFDQVLQCTTSRSASRTSYRRMHETHGAVDSISPGSR